MATATSTIRFEKYYKPGGVAQIVVGDIVGRIIESGTDESGMGRYSMHELQGRRGSKLVIITAYRVTNTTANGPETTYTQQVAVMRKNGVQTPNPRRQILDDLKKKIMECISCEKEVILCMDANEDSVGRKSEIGKLMRELGLIDLHVYRHGSEKLPETYNRGKSKIDFMLGTYGVARNMIGAGIHAYGATMRSDHRGMHVDLNISALLHGKIAKMATPSTRGVRSNSIRKVERYKAEVTRYFEDHKIENRLEKLKEKTKDEWTANDNAELEAVDRDITRAMLAAEKKCRVKDPIAFTRELARGRKLITFWKLWLTELKTNRDTWEQRDAILRELKVTEPLHLSMEHPTARIINGKLKEQQQKCRNMVANAPERRENELRELSKAMAADNKHDEAKIYQRIMESEQDKKEYSHLRRILNKDNSGGLTHLLAPSTNLDECIELIRNGGIDTCDQNETIIDAEIIEKLLMARNKKHFGQAKGTPFTVIPLKDLLGWCGDTAFADMLLEGKVEMELIEGLDKGAKKIMEKVAENLKMRDTVVPTITKEDVVRNFKRWKETTSTSPSGRHLGHYKTLARWRSSKNKEEKENLTAADRILQGIGDVVNLAFRNEHPLDRWRDITNVMIEKIKGKPYLNKMRVIHLFEADLNMAIGYFYREGIREAERNHLMGDQQYGARKGKCAEDVLHMKRLTIDTARMTKTSTGIFDNDAKACFDRMIPNLITLLGRYIGISKEICNTHAKILLEARYRIKTTLGVSAEYYSNTEEEPLYGPGQGGTASMFIWGIVSNMLLEIMREEKNGITMLDPGMTNKIQRVMDAFVDDTTGWVNNFSKELAGPQHADNLKLILEELTGTAQLWEQLLTASGGALELNKCFYYIVKWIWEDGVARMATGEENPTSITIKSSITGEDVHITKKECTESHKTLGVMMNPAGNFKDETNRLINKASNIARCIAAKPIRRREGWKLALNIIIPGISYGMGVTVIPKGEIDKVESIIMPPILQKVGCNSNMTRDVVFGPKDMGGLGLTRMYTEQGTRKIMALMQHVRANSTVGQAMTINLKWHQMICGVGFHVMTKTNEPIVKVDGGEWIEEVRTFLNKSACSLIIRDSYRVENRRRNDRPIMEVAVEHGYHGRELEAINHMRLYLQVETISDISNAKGDKLASQIELGNKSGLISSSNYAWPVQQKPHWGKWKKFMNQLTNENGKLMHVLGDWSRGCWKHRKWLHVYDSKQQVVIIQSVSGMWQEYETSEIQKKRHRWEVKGNGKDRQSRRPTGGIPIDLEAGTIFIPQWERTKTRDDKGTGWLDGIPRWESELLENSTDVAHNGLSNALKTNQDIVVCSDGGCVAATGSFGWVIGTKSGNNLQEGKGLARGCPMSSFRAEAYGRLAATTFLHRYREMWSITTNNKYTFLCDNKGLLHRMNAFQKRITDSPKFYTEPDQDIIMEIEAKQRLLEAKQIDAQHVKGHQDNSNKELSMEARMNIRADKLATEVLDDRAVYEQPVEMTPLTCPCYLAHRGQIITSHERRILKRAYDERRLKEQVGRYNQWSKDTVEGIDWTVIKAARAREGSKNTVFTTKMMHGWLPTAARQHRHNQVPNNNCILCRLPETQEHLWQCEKRTNEKGRIIRELWNMLNKMGTKPILRNEITKSLTNWVNGHEATLFGQQQKIGVYGMIRGYISKEWVQEQQQYLYSREKDGNNKTYDSGKKWATHLVLHFWNCNREIWKNRNEAVHNPTSVRDIMEIIVRQQYELQEQCTAFDRRFIFKYDLETMLRQPLSEIKAWLNISKDWIQTSIEQHQKESTRNTQNIASYFK
jgi:hypothetical protein